LIFQNLQACTAATPVIYALVPGHIIYVQSIGREEKFLAQCLC
jgi:hypothetical protein